MTAITYSFTFLRDEETCPEQARSVHVNKTYKKHFTKALEVGVDAHTAVEHRVKHRTPLPAEHLHFEPIVASFEKLGPIEAELPLAVNHRCEPVGFWGGSGIGHQTVPWIRGKYDVVIRNPAQRKALMGDWKTGRQDYEKELQLELGALLLMWNDPGIDTVAGINVYLKTGRPGRPYLFKRDEMSPRTARLVKRTRDIDARDVKVEWEKRPSGLCPWCPVASCQHFQGGKGR